MYPTFIIVGAAKAGTTTMFELLGAHPDVFVSDPKEPHFFSRLTTFDSRREWYESLFSGTEGYGASGEASTSYAHPHRIDFVAPRIREHIPECRLIYMVRHPVRRLESDWRMRRLENRISPRIDQAVEANASLLTFGLYWKHLKVYRSSFQDEQILVVFLEDFSLNPARELQRVYRHIGVDPTFLPASPARATNTAGDRARAETIKTISRRIPGAKQVASLLPDQVSEKAKELLARSGRPVPEVEWAPDRLKAVCDFFRKDAESLLRHCNKPIDFWNLEGGT